MPVKLKPVFQELTYYPDSAALMLRLSELPCSVFLDSSNNEDRGARYDILTAAPTASIYLQKGQVLRISHYADDPATEVLQEDIFTAVKSTLALYQSNSLQTVGDKSSAEHADFDNKLSAMPFTGGAAGYFGYHSGDLYKSGDPYKGADVCVSGKTFESDESGKLPTAHIGIYHWAIVVDHQLQKTHFFVLTDCPLPVREQVNALMSSDRKLATPPAFMLTEPFTSNMSPAVYKPLFERLKKYIEAGDCYQANLAQRFHSRYLGTPLLAYLQLRERSKSPFSAYLGMQDNAILSLSPERFLQTRQRKVLTQPIKGTRRRGTNPAQDEALKNALCNSEKDRAENLMIVDLLRNDLGSICKTGTVKTEKLFELQSFNSVHHLVSTISGELPEDKSPLDLLRNCFPGGSITGAPKIRAMQIIAELEPDPRQIYCGAIGYIGFDGQMDTNITIRTLLCEQGKIYCWGGGGIVADSVCEQEYQEGHDKVTLLLCTLQDMNKSNQ